MLNVWLKYISGQKGFTLIELLVALAISGVLAGGICTAIFQIGNISDINNSSVIAVKQVENAVHYINRDVRMAQNIDSDGDDYWLKLSWTNWDDNSKHEVKYSLADTDLSRRYSVDEVVQSEIKVARFISYVQITSPDTEASPPEKSYRIAVSSTVTTGLKQAAETREIKIIPRTRS